MSNETKLTNGAATVQRSALVTQYIVDDDDVLNISTIRKVGWDNEKGEVMVDYRDICLTREEFRFLIKAARLLGFLGFVEED